MSSAIRPESVQFHLPVEFEVGSDSVTARLGKITVTQPIHQHHEFNAKRDAVFAIQAQILKELSQQTGSSHPEEDTHS